MTSIENIRKRVEAFVDVISIDSPLTHLSQIFLFKYQEKICGSFGQHEIKIWMSSNSIIGAFYPVIQLTFGRADNKIIIRSKMNQIGLWLAILVNIAIIRASLNMFILRVGLSADSFLERIIVFVVFIGIFNFPMYMSYRSARDVLMSEVEKRVQGG